MLQEKFNSYLAELYSCEKSNATIAKYAHDVKCFLQYSHKESVTKRTVNDYKQYLAEKYCLSTTNSMLVALNSFFKFCGRYDLCVKLFKIQKDAFRKEERELSREEYRRLVITAQKQKDQRLSLVIQTVCGTGIRISELKFITVQAVRCGKATVTAKGKTRTVYIIKSLRDKLTRYIKLNNIKEGPVFVSKNGNPLNRSNIWRDMKKLCKDAEVSPNKVFPHNLRHLFARTFYDLDKDIARLADILGHSSIDTTRIYTAISSLEHSKRLESMRLII